MFRTNLDFLESMFPEARYMDYNILIINQTDDKRQLISKYDNIRVINTLERGLPQSRNLAIKNAKGEICLVADDDVQYVKDFKQIIEEAYLNNPEAIVQTFQMVNFEGELYRDYPDVKEHTKRTIESVNGVVITFKPGVLIKEKVFYNVHFGLGATFQTANEYVFMKNVLRAKIKAFFVKRIILAHPNVSSGQAIASDRVLYARAALMYKYYGIWSYFWIFKYLRFLIAHKHIGFHEVFQKMKIGFVGIFKYKELLKNGLEKR